MSGQRPFVPNPQQKIAIEHVHGPMLVVAGAGTGKTTVLVERIARLVANGDARAEEILAVTYTKNAAGELQDRVRKCLLDRGILTGTGITATTFHAYSNGLLARCGRSFDVLDDKDLYVYLARRLNELGLEFYTRAVNPGEFLGALNDFFSRCHDELVTVADYRAYVDRLRAGERPLPRVVPSGTMDKITEDEVLARCAEIAHVYETVERWLAADNLGTYGHMVLRAVKALRSDAALLASERQRTRFILMDEFQDANFGQIDLAALLAGEAANVFAVGDPDQAIYRFRGASDAAFEEFSRRWPDAAGVMLGDNQRSRTPALRCAFALIANNPPARCRVGGREFRRELLKSAREAAGDAIGEAPLVEIAICDGENPEAGHVGEAEYVGQRIADLRSTPPADAKKARFGVLYRSHANREQVMRALYERGIKPCVTGVNALETAEARDLMACLRTVANPADTEALFRVAALPVFGLDGEEVREVMRPGDAALEAVLQRVAGGAHVVAAVQVAREAAAKLDMSPARVIRDVVERFGLPATHPAIIAIRAFVVEWTKKPSALTGTGDLRAFLDYMDWFDEAGGSLPAEDDPGDDLGAPRLMTAHGSKGLEFEHVFVLRVASGSFPTNYRERLFEFPEALRRSERAQGESNDVHREEERRLFYVAMTRARESLTVCGRPGRGKARKPSGFVKELLGDKAAAAFRRETTVTLPPQPARVDLAAAAADTGLASWLLLPPHRRIVSPLVLSATAVETYEKCPLRFKLDRDWKIPGAPAVAMQYGNIVHLVLKDFYDALRAGRPRAVEDSLKLFRGLLADAHFEDEHQRGLYRRQGEQHLTNFFAVRAQEPAPLVERTEWSFEVRIGSVSVQGRVDRVDRISEGLAVIDYKTGRARKQKEADESLQLSLYAVATEAKLGRLPARLVIYNVEDASVITTSRAAGDLDVARERVVVAADGIAAGHFEATPDPFLCRWCEYRKLCPATEQKLYMDERAAGAG
jgi:DNA helicase-2/ATP-dependent DNA helicase PcrA